MSNENKIKYRRVGDYLVPNFILPPEEKNIILGKWGMLYKDYLLNHKKAVFSSLLVEGKLYQHCAEVENQANEMFDMLIEQMKKAEGVTEQLKDQDQWEWVRRMETVQHRANEIVCIELIYT